MYYKNKYFCVLILDFSHFSVNCFTTVVNKNLFHHNI